MSNPISDLSKPHASLVNIFHKISLDQFSISNNREHLKIGLTDSIGQCIYIKSENKTKGKSKIDDCEFFNQTGKKAVELLNTKQSTNTN